MRKSPVFLAIIILFWGLRPAIGESLEEFRKTFDGFNMSVYSEAPVGENHLLGGGYHEETNQLRGIKGESSSIGLFRPNKDMFFGLVDSHGKIVFESRFHLNNYGLESKFDYRKTKDPDEFRIVVLGGEQTAATTANVSWPDYLQELIDAKKFGIAGKNKVTVLNFAHLDTGYPQYEYIFKERALAFKPDLVLINTVSFDFDRTFPAVTPPPGYLYVTLPLPDGEKAVSVFPCAGPPSYDDPTCQPSKLIPVWLPEKVARNQKEILSVREQVIATAYQIGHKRAVATDAPTAGAPAPAPTAQELAAAREQRDQSLVDQAAAHLRGIISAGVPVLIIQNPLGPQAVFGDPGNTYRLTRLIEQRYPGLHVIDMRRYLPKASDETKRSWFAPLSLEKWTDAGHRAYAEAVFQVLYQYATALAKNP